APQGPAHGRRAGRARHPVHPGARAGGHHPERRLAVQRRPRLHPLPRQIRGAGEGPLRQADQLHAAQKQQPRAGKAVFRVHGAGPRGGLRHRLAGAHVHLLPRRALHRRALHLPRPRPLGQRGAARPVQAGGRRDREARAGDADRLRGRRRAEHLRQQAPPHLGRPARAQGAGAGRADLEPHLPGHRHVADRDRLQRDLQRHPKRRHRRRRERSGRRGADALLRGGAAARPDAARHHHPAALLLLGHLHQAAQRPPGGHPPRRARGGHLRPADRVGGGRVQAGGAGEGRPPEARRVHRAGADETPGGPGDAGLRQGDRRRADSAPHRRHQRV
ncbi:MAG: TRAP-type C4-dicarboxylate transport system, periplasmic component, partial [uncultured Acetobacteraceae bacterium]